MVINFFVAIKQLAWILTATVLGLIFVYMIVVESKVKNREISDQQKRQAPPKRRRRRR